MVEEEEEEEKKKKRIVLPSLILTITIELFKKSTSNNSK